QRERPRRLIFDAARVTFIDCASARLITGTSGWLPPGVKPVIASPSPIVRRVFQASGLSARCELEPRGLPGQPPGYDSASGRLLRRVAEGVRCERERLVGGRRQAVVQRAEHAGEL